jgi:hypothetical protein
MILRSILTTAIAATALSAAPASAANFLKSSVDNPLASSAGGATAGGVRFRSLFTSRTEQEVYLGRHDLGVGGNRAQQHQTWAAANSFTLSYDAGSDKLTSIVNGASIDFTNFTGSLTGAVKARPLNRLVISIRDAAATTGTISLTNLALGGTALAPKTLNGVDGAIRYWTVAGDFRQSFSLTGQMNLAGNFGTSAEANNVQILVGNAVPEPATWAMMISGFGLAGAAMRRRAKVNVAFA